VRGGRKLIQRHGGSAARGCARLAPDRARLARGDRRRGRQRVFPFQMPNLREAAHERAPGSLCEECLASFERVPNIICEVCGRPLARLPRDEEQMLLCPACQDRTYAFDRARSFAVYQSAVVRAILLLKFEKIEPLGAWFAERLAEMVVAGGDRLAADVVVPVPLHRERERARGYNQAALLSNRWRKGSDCRIKRCCSCARGRGRTSKR